MIAPRVADFLFAGAALLPPILALAADAPEAAVFPFLILLIGGATFAIADPEAPHRSRR